jgi:rhodanese-related sulfurtransferase
LFVIFGATGDLSYRKLIPALYHADLDPNAHEGHAILGVARAALTDDQFRSAAVEALGVPPTDAMKTRGAEIEALWEEIGVDPDEEVIVSCGGGWRSSLAFLYGYVMGYPVRNYANGWSEWSTTYGPPPDYEQSPTGNPIATGVP